MVDALETTDRTLRLLLEKPRHEVRERPLEALKHALAVGWAEATPYTRAWHNGMVWYQREVSITAAGRAEAARRGLT